MIAWGEKELLIGANDAPNPDPAPSFRKNRDYRLRYANIYLNRSAMFFDYRRTQPKPIVKPRPQAPVDLKAGKADKLYRTALDAERMGQRSIAKTFYKKIVEEYPGTPAATRAAERLKKF